MNNIPISHRINILDVLFRCISPEYVFDSLNGRSRTDLPLFTSVDSFDENDFYKVFCYYGRIVSPEYSTSDRLINQYHSMFNWLKEEDNSTSIMKLLGKMSFNMLNFVPGKYPYYKKNEIWNFRELSLKLGQDMILCSAYAYAYAESHANIPGDNQYNCQIIDFCWPYQLHGDNSFIAEEWIHKQGNDGEIADNHFHLYGSLPSFELSWISLMNHSLDAFRTNKDLEQFEKDFKNNLDLSVLLSHEDYQLPWIRRLQIASWIRARLFKRLHEGIRVSDDELLRDFFSFTDYSGNTVFQLSRMTNYLRHKYGYHFKKAKSQKHYKDIHHDNVFMHDILDYAILKPELDGKNRYYATHENKLCNNLVLSGERGFLYNCFSKSSCGSNENKDAFTIQEENLFYLYLLIKMRFRSEMIQLNKVKGFSNFQMYQRRKNMFWINNKSYFKEAMKMGIADTIEEGNMKSLEARIMPSNTVEQYCYTAREIDDAVCKYQDDPKKYRENFYYVIHFPKKADKNEKGKYQTQFIRNGLSRSVAQKQTLKLATTLSKHKSLRTRIKGIDACSKEIGCRPETYATEFRFLKAFESKRSYDNCIINLGRTYHVGEDFEDFIDGLRAVDETLTFLNLDQGDRIGHGTILGLSPSIYYKDYNFTMSLSRQMLLDNLAWLLSFCENNSITINKKLENCLKKETVKLFKTIYGSRLAVYDIKGILNMNDDGLIQTYQDSMLLRGDHPSLYEKQFDDVDRIPFTSFDVDLMPGGKLVLMNQYKARMLNMFPAEISRIREKKECYTLYRMYHYDTYSTGNSKSCRVIGDEIIDYSIPKSYQSSFVSVVKKIQQRLFSNVQGRGIHIEMNPTSNVMIGAFDSYREHPLFEYIGSKRNAEQLPNVSIYTDDKGIFYTSLSNEYNFVETAMKLNGYNNAEIRRYLENFRKKSLEASF